MESAQEDQALRQTFRELAAGPDLYLKEIDPGRGIGTFVEMDRTHFERSRFLDYRIARKGTTVFDIPLGVLARLEAPLRGIAKPVNMIFHVGHCGSSLLSRLLGAVGEALSLREPEPLRVMARSWRRVPEGTQQARNWELIFSVIMSLMSRRHDADWPTIVKPSSFCTNLMPKIVGLHPENRAVFLWNRIGAHLAIMAKPANRSESDHLFERDHRSDLEVRFQVPAEILSGLTNMQRAALNWAVNLNEFAVANARPDHAERVLMIEFDALLADCETCLTLICHHFRLPISETSVAQVLAREDLMRSHAKHSGERFDQETRAAEIAKEQDAHRSEIADCIAWLLRLVDENPGLAPMKPYIDAERS